MSRHFSPFTREDEKELFKDGQDPNFLDDFRSFYTGANSTESCSADVTIYLSHATVDEIESWDTNAAPIGIMTSFGSYNATLKLPDSIRKLQLRVHDPEKSFARDSEKFCLPFVSYHQLPDAKDFPREP
jgi:hypothetical protein